MAMTNCFECDNEVSDKAMKCNSCGIQLRKAIRTGFSKFIKVSFNAFNILMLTLVAVVAVVAVEAENMSFGGGVEIAVLIYVWISFSFFGALLLPMTRPRSA